MSVIASRVENRRSGVSLPVACGLGFRLARLNPGLTVALLPVPAHRIGLAELPHPGSRKRHTMFRVTPSATSEHDSGWLDSSSIPHVLRCFLRPSLTEAASLRRSYPASGGTTDLSASGCVISDLLQSQDISYPQNFGHLRRKASFSTPTGVSTHRPTDPDGIFLCFSAEIGVCKGRRQDTPLAQPDP
jgi:hypothetical protein